MNLYPINNSRNVQLIFLTVLIVGGVVLGLTLLLTYYNPYEYLVVIGCLLLILVNLMKPIVGLIILVIAAGLIDYRNILEVRVFIGEFPINLVEIATIVALPGFCLHSVRSRKKRNDRKNTFFALIIILLSSFLAIEFIRAVSENQNIYETVRFCRNIILITFAFLLTRKYVVSQVQIKVIVYLMLFTGFYGIIVSLSQRLPYISEYTTYLDIRTLGRLTPTSEIVLVFSWAFLISKYYLLGNKFLTLMLVVLSIISNFLTFSLTPYFMVLLITLIGVILAEIPLRKKLIIGIGLWTLPIFLFSIASFEVSPTGQFLYDILYLIKQPAQQMWDLRSSIHFKGRLISWMETLSMVSGNNFLYGLGIGIIERIQTGISEVGVVLLGEPTYSNYLLKVGIIGLLLLFVLQIRFVLVSYQYMSAAKDSSIKAIMLAFTIYGITIVINGFLHNMFLAPQNSVLFGVMLGLVEAAGNLKTDLGHVLLGS